MLLIFLSTYLSCHLWPPSVSIAPRKRDNNACIRHYNHEFLDIYNFSIYLCYYARTFLLWGHPNVHANYWKSKPFKTQKRNFDILGLHRCSIMLLSFIGDGKTNSSLLWCRQRNDVRILSCPFTCGFGKEVIVNCRNKSKKVIMNSNFTIKLVISMRYLTMSRSVVYQTNTHLMVCFAIDGTMLKATIIWDVHWAIRRSSKSDHSMATTRITTHSYNENCRVRIFKAMFV